MKRKPRAREGHKEETLVARSYKIRQAVPTKSNNQTASRTGGILKSTLSRGAEKRKTFGLPRKKRLRPSTGTGRKTSAKRRRSNQKKNMAKEAER